MVHKGYSIIRSPIYENNDIRKSWIVYRHGILTKFTSAAVFATSSFRTLTVTLALLQSQLSSGTILFTSAMSKGTVVQSRFRVAVSLTVLLDNGASVQNILCNNVHLYG